MEAVKIKSSTAAMSSAERYDELFKNGLPVKDAFLHQALFVPGLPAEKTLNTTKIPGVEMSLTPSFLMLKARGHRVSIAIANMVDCTH